SSSDLEKRLSRDIRVSTGSVGRRFPFVLEVNVTDRVPLAIVQDEFGYVFLDKDGVVMDSTQSIKKVNVPLITGKRLGNLLLGDSIAGGEIDQALDFLNHLSPEGLKVFSEINIGNPEDIKAYTRDGITVKLGNGSDMAGQARLAENMVGDVKARGLSVEYLDANLASPFIKLKK
ncbi:cell division protein FtsQ/DivIB, partial [Dialister succinatiphilus]|uniref:cell division protein FtsQ/DivIB n=1 Tax=Dialister succinatiphilus TaxID=487173 RepID=UPI0040292182